MRDVRDKERQGETRKVAHTISANASTRQHDHQPTTSSAGTPLCQPPAPLNVLWLFMVRYLCLFMVFDLGWGVYPFLVCGMLAVWYVWGLLCTFSVTFV